MSFRIEILFVWTSLAYLLRVQAGDVYVQLNVNRPFNDVNEKFVSFAMKPEELYRALDGDNRRIVTRMAAILGDSYIKFTDDYNFAMSSERKLRNPTKIIWKGFNRWASAVNWTMVIPMPYDPETWDPMETLRILNSSYLSGIRECVWQLGTDFGESYAEDYVAELNTLSMMVEAFKPYTDDWSMMGADISAGSSAEETRRYIEMTRKLNSAYGWTPSSSTNALTSSIHDNDPSLRMLLKEKVPVWLTLPQKQKSKATSEDDETSEALTWAKTLGETASSGFDAIFKPITAEYLEKPNFTYFVTALFKRVMGSRVFPSRPLGAFGKTNKFYTHCANSVSGGLAFMIANTNENPIAVQVQPFSKMSAPEMWQYTLTMKKGSIYLNNEKLRFNSTLRPQKIVSKPNRSVQLSTPGKSVSFWVMPKVNLEHCQYTEIVAENFSNESDEKEIEKRYSSADRLLRKLIEESSLANRPLAQAINRRRRYAGKERRPKRFVLKDRTRNAPAWGKLFNNFGAIEERAVNKPIAKRENILKTPSIPKPFEWFTNLMQNTMTGEMPLLQRGTRSVDDDYFGPLFATRDGKTTTAFTKKITEIKKPEKPIKPLFDMDEFDEEEFFKKIENYREPEVPRYPEGDVILKLIENAEGEEEDEYKEERVREIKKIKSKSFDRSEETVDEMKPLKLLPTEFYEALPLNPFKPKSKNFVSDLNSGINSLLFPEPFAKKPTKTKKVLNIEKDTKTGTKQSSSQAREFLRMQKELGKLFLEDHSNNNNNNNNDDSNESDSKKSKEDEKDSESTTTKASSKKSSKISSSELENPKATKDEIDSLYRDFFKGNFENYFGNNDNEAQDISLKSKETEEKSQLGSKKFDELPWWNLDPPVPKRRRRALYFNLPDDVVHSNMINRDDDLLPLGAVVSPAKLATYEYHVEKAQNKDESSTTTTTTTKAITETSEEKKTTESSLVSTLKEKVTNFVDIFARHMNEWYDTLTRHIDIVAGNSKDAEEETTTTSNKVN